MQDLKAIQENSEDSSIEEHEQEEKRLEDQIKFTCKFRKECYKPILNYLDILFGPEIVDQTPKILSLIQPDNNYFKLFNVVKSGFVLIAFLVFYFSICLPEYRKVDDLLFEINSVDEAQKVYEMKLNPTDFPIRHISWFDLKEIY